MVERYFALGDEAKLQRLCAAAGIAGANAQSRKGFARFASIDELTRIEIRGSPLGAVVDDASYERVLETARRELARHCDAQGAIELRLDATIVTASRS
jgi:hypothetical protein